MSKNLSACALHKGLKKIPQALLGWQSNNFEVANNLPKLGQAKMSATDSALACAELPALLGQIKRRAAPLGSTVYPQLMFLGPPGCGKGTQSEWLKTERGLAHLSTGDMLRAAIAAQTDIGNRAKAVVDAGELVPDEMVLAIVKTKLIELRSQPGYRGFVLDGFPRTEAQAIGLDQMLSQMGTQLSGVFHFEVNDTLLERRICGRRIHLPSGRTYHVEFKPPKVEGKDDETGEDLIHREDDKPEVIGTRLASYHSSTAPLIQFYKQKKLLFTVDASQEAEAVRADMEALLALGRASGKPTEAAASATPSTVTTTTTN